MMINCEISVFQNRENGEKKCEKHRKMALKSAFSVFQNREKVKENGEFPVFRKKEENGIFSVFQNRENGEFSFQQKTENGIKKGNSISPFLMPFADRFKKSEITYLLPKPSAKVEI